MNKKITVTNYGQRFFYMHNDMDVEGLNDMFIEIDLPFIAEKGNVTVLYFLREPHDKKGRSFYIWEVKQKIAEQEFHDRYEDGRYKDYVPSENLITKLKEFSEVLNGTALMHKSKFDKDKNNESYYRELQTLECRRIFNEYFRKIIK